MSHLRKPGNRDLSGFDASRNLQILPLARKTSFYLVGADGLDVFVENPDCADLAQGALGAPSAQNDKALTGWEKTQVIRPITVTARAPGTTRLRATYLGSDWIEPLTIRVTQNPDARQVGRGRAEVTPELRAELEGMPLREAVIRVAEDQMNSAICRTTRGFGIYNMDASADWCGGFAYWCWDQACAILGTENPFGPRSSVLWSPQRALHWAMQDTAPAHILRWGGSSPMDGKGRQEVHEIGWNGLSLRRADIVLLRKGTAGGWKHVCMVHRVEGKDLITIDGNQGSPCIKIVKRDLMAKLPDGSWQHVFLSVIRA